MANIDVYLAAILSAVYGEDVRGSIHDAIEIINDVSEVVLTTGTAITGPTSSSAGFFTDSLYLNTDTYELWKCTGTDTWLSQGILKGDDGDPGPAGANGNKWYIGTGISGKAVNPTVYSGSGVAEANANDCYLNNSEGAVYHCVLGGDPTVATWVYDFTMTGGGGGGSYTAGNGITISVADVISIDPGTIANGNTKPVTGGDVFTALQGKADVGSVPSDLDDLTDVVISSPSNDQVIKYNNGNWVNGPAPAGGHTMLPTPNASVDESAVVSAVKGGITEGGINDDVASLYGIGKWSNTMTKTYKIQGIAGSSTPITQSGIGNFDMTGVDQTGWVTIPALIGSGTDPYLDIKLGFDPTTVSVPITLGGWVVDDSTGKMCIKFGNEIPEADTHTALVTVEVIFKRTEVVSVS